MDKSLEQPHSDVHQFHMEALYRSKSINCLLFGVSEPSGLELVGETATNPESDVSAVLLFYAKRQPVGLIEEEKRNGKEVIGR